MASPDPWRCLNKKLLIFYFFRNITPFINSVIEYNIHPNFWKLVVYLPQKFQNIQMLVTLIHRLPSLHIVDDDGPPWVSDWRNDGTCVRDFIYTRSSNAIVSLVTTVKGMEKWMYGRAKLYPFKNTHACMSGLAKTWILSQIVFYMCVFSICNIVNRIIRYVQEWRRRRRFQSESPIL